VSHFRRVSFVAWLMLAPVLVASCTRSGDGQAVSETSVSGTAQGGTAPSKSPVENVARSDATAVYKSRLVPAGTPAPVFSLQRLGGGRVSLASLRGQVVLLSFWTASCPPCHLEAPHLQRLHRTYQGRGVRVVGVTPLTPLEEIRAFVTRHGLTYPIAVDPGEKVIRRYGLQGYPALVLLDRRGVIRWTHPGYRPSDERTLEARLRALL